ncbi:MAG: hypothetical protein II885_17235 [Oscillospiraceae bacterium]|nr:hypothetical protein [Oscillospiraceae bacterium]
MKKVFLPKKIDLDNLTPERKAKLLEALFLTRLLATEDGDREAVAVINDMITMVTLDKAKPDYKNKLQAIRNRLNKREAICRAEKVIQATGRPLCFDDAYNAISQAIDSAVDYFNRAPCAKHAADLLGLIRCQDLLIESEPNVDEGTADRKDDD